MNGPKKIKDHRRGSWLLIQIIFAKSNDDDLGSVEDHEDQAVLVYQAPQPVTQGETIQGGLVIQGDIIESVKFNQLLKLGVASQKLVLFCGNFFFA